MITTQLQFNQFNSIQLKINVNICMYYKQRSSQGVKRAIWMELPGAKRWEAAAAAAKMRCCCWRACAKSHHCCASASAGLPAPAPPPPAPPPTPAAPKTPGRWPTDPGMANKDCAGLPWCGWPSCGWLCACCVWKNGDGRTDASGCP